MRFLFLLSYLSLTLALCASAEDLSSPAQILAKVAERYKTLSTYQIQAEVEITMTRQGASGQDRRKVLLTVGKDGAYHVGQTDSSGSEMVVSDGKTTWKADESRKLWSKQEIAHVQATEEDSADDQDSDQFQGQDLFSQTQRSFVARYLFVAHYGNTASLEKSEKLKLNGNKVDCYVVTVQLKDGMNRLYIDKNTFYVVRHLEKGMSSNTMVGIKTDYHQIDTNPPSPELFAFSPPRAVAKSKLCFSPPSAT